MHSRPVDMIELELGAGSCSSFSLTLEKNIFVSFNENVLQINSIPSLIRVLLTNIYLSLVRVKNPKFLSEICRKGVKKGLKIKHQNFFASNYYLADVDHLTNSKETKSVSFSKMKEKDSKD